MTNLNRKPYFIAEIGVNHEGSINKAMEMVKTAHENGADAVKFQTFRTENFIRKIDKKRFNQLKKFELSYKQFKSLRDLAHKNKLKFIIKLDKNRLRPEKSEVMRLISSNKKAKKILNWEPKYIGNKGLNLGLAKTLNWYKQNRNYISSDFII